MKVIIVLASDILKFPPVLNLVNILNDMSIKTTVICTRTEFDVKDMKYVKLSRINIDYENIFNPLVKMIKLPEISDIFWKKINEFYEEDSILWVVSNLTLKYLGNKIKKYKYILHFLELSENLKYYNKIPFLKLNAYELCSKSLGVIVPEYNRAHILQAWWGLEKTPFVFSNKPYIKNVIDKNSDISNKEARVIFEKVQNKKVILYQGILDAERPLDKFIKAIGKLGEDFVFLVMSGGKNIYSNLKENNYYFIPFVKPPYHLEITSHAYIGVLSYFPTKDTGYSVLNTLYCAPNKTFEYGMFGVPMLGNNIPGLRFLFETQKCGICFDNFTEEDIIKGIKSIEKNYKYLSDRALEYFNSVDSETEIKTIFDNICLRYI